MPVTLYTPGKTHARQLIDQGDVDEGSSWDFTADDENAVLGDPPNWTDYAAWHLGHDDAASDDTKAAWKYAFGKNGNVYRSALRAIVTRAGQESVTDIADAAKELLAAMDEKQTSDFLARLDQSASARHVARPGSRSWYRIEAKANDTVDVAIYDAIGAWYDGVSAKQFVADLQALPASVKTIRVHVNSPGGDAFDAVAIANALKLHPARVEMVIEGLAASAATIITNGGGDAIQIADNALVMIHNPYAMAMGTAKDMRDAAEMLDRVGDVIITTYQRHSPLDHQTLADMMEATTWMDADQAIANGFATEKVAGLAAAALLDPRAVTALEVPDRFRARVDALTARPADGTGRLALESAAASAADVLRLCRESDCLALAEALVQDGATLEQAQARIAAAVTARDQAAARERDIRAACALARLPQLADAYVRGGMALEAVRAQLTTLTAMGDQLHIDGSLPPNPGGTPKPKARINTADVYARRNHLTKEQ